MSDHIIIRYINKIFDGILENDIPIFNDSVETLSLYTKGTQMRFYIDCLTVAVIYKTLQTDLLVGTPKMHDEYLYEIANTISTTDMHDWKRSLGSYGESIGHIIMKAEGMSKQPSQSEH